MEKIRNVDDRIKAEVERMVRETKICSPPAWDSPLVVVTSEATAQAASVIPIQAVVTEEDAR